MLLSTRQQHFFVKSEKFIDLRLCRRYNKGDVEHSTKLKRWR